MITGTTNLKTSFNIFKTSQSLIYIQKVARWLWAGLYQENHKYKTTSVMTWRNSLDFLKHGSVGRLWTVSILPDVDKFLDKA